MARRQGRELTDEEAREFDKFQGQISQTVDAASEKESETAKKQFDAANIGEKNEFSDILATDRELAKKKASLDSKAEIDKFAAQRKGIEDAYTDMQFEKKHGKTTANLRQLAKKDIAAAKAGFSAVKSGVKNVDPLAGFKPKEFTGKRKAGRPQEFKTVRKGVKRPVGRPSKKSLSIGGNDFFEAGGVPKIRREPYVPPTPTQSLMLDMLGDKNQSWGFGGNPVRINNQLGSGGGIMKSGDGGRTGSFFGMGRRRQ